jgi:predicted outer membrane protein
MAAFMAGGARADTTVDAGQRLKKDHMTEPIRGALWAALVGAMTFALNEPPVSTAVAAASPRESLFTPRELVGTLHRVDEIELEAGKMAERSGGTQAMRDYGATLQHDSVAAAERLKRYARRHHIPVEANPPFGVAGELARARGELDNLENLGGASFDREFAEMMVRDHSKAHQRLATRRAPASSSARSVLPWRSGQTARVRSSTTTTSNRCTAASTAVARTQ